jgi:hypothetical protein
MLLTQESYPFLVRGGLVLTCGRLATVVPIREGKGLPKQIHVPYVQPLPWYPSPHGAPPCRAPFPDALKILKRNSFFDTSTPTWYAKIATSSSQIIMPRFAALA